MKLVEFTGIPGSGKSTLYQALLEQSDKPNWLVAEAELYRVLVEKHAPIHKTIWNKLTGQTFSDDKAKAFVLGNKLLESIEAEYQQAYPEVFQTLTSLLQQTYANDPQIQRMEKLVLQPFVQSYSAQKYLKENQGFLLDEGHCQKATSTLLSPNRYPDSVQIHAYQQIMPRIEVIIDVHLPPELALERITNRKKGVPQRLQDLSEQGMLDYLKQSRQLLDTMLENEIFDNTCIIRLDGQHDVEANIIQFLQALV